MSSPKLESWGGANKSRVRLFKKHDITKFIRDDGFRYDRPDYWKPHMVSFPGPKAVLERLLVNHDILPSNNITAIQTYETLSRVHNGRLFLNKLIKTRKKHLPSMRIWPYNFKRFSEKYKLDGCTYPSDSTQSKWCKMPYKRFMDQIVKEPTKKFSIMDLDLCGIFNKKNADTIENLFKNRIIEPSGLLFITHQKGRDVRGGTLFDVLHTYLKKCSFLEFNSIPHLDKEDYATYVARYIMVPLYYMCKAYEYGYVVKMTRLIEYRDFGAGAGNAVNMLQYFFKWEDADYITDADTQVRTNLEYIMDDEYEYLSMVA